MVDGHSACHRDAEKQNWCTVYSQSQEDLLLDIICRREREVKDDSKIFDGATR